MTSKSRHGFLIVLLTMTMLATAYTFFNSQPEMTVVEAYNSTGKHVNTSQRDVEAIFSQPIPTHRETEGRRTFYSPSADVFEVYVPPKKTAQIELPPPEIKPKVKKITLPVIQAPQPVVNPVPAAPPPLPFRYIGKLLGDDEYTVFLYLQGKNLSVKMGDIIQQTYKVEEIKPPVMQLTYMPMNIKQTLMIGEP